MRNITSPSRKTVLRGTVALALLLAVPLSPLPLSAQDATATSAEEERDRSFLSDLIENAISTEDQVVRIDGFRGALSSEATVARLSIADANGEWLVARDLVLDWNRSALFGRKLEVNRLRAGAIEIIRAPEGDAPPASPESVPFALPNLPVSVNVGEIAADSIKLGQALFGQAVELQLTGTADLADGAGNANFAATRIDGTEGRFAFDGGFSNTTRDLAVHLALEEGPGGIAATLLSLPDNPAVRLTIDGEDPIDNFNADIALATNGVDRVTGTFGLGTTGEGAAVERAFMLALDGDVSPLLAEDYRPFFGDSAVLNVTGRTPAEGGLDLSALDIRTNALRLSGSAAFDAAGWPQHIDVTGDLGLASGDPVTVRAMDLDVGYDRSADDAWTAAFTMTELGGDGYGVPVLVLEGGGTIRPPASPTAGTGDFTAALDYRASGLRLDNGALAEAIGQEVTGRLTAHTASGDPFTIDSLTVDSAGLNANLTGRIGAENPDDTGLPYDLDITLAAESLTRFAALTGLDLQGAADLTVGVTGALIDNTIAIDIAGQTRDLALGIEAADAVLGGAGEVALRLARDGDGTRLEHLALQTTALTASGAATLTSGDSAGTFSLLLDDTARVVAGLSGAAEVSGSFTNTQEAGLAVDARATLPGAQTTFTAAQPVGAQSIALDLIADIPALAAFAEAAGLDLTGSANITLQGAVGGGATDLALTGRTKDIAIGIPEADRLIAGDGTLDARILQGDDGVTRMDGLRLVTRGLDGTADLVLDNGKTDADFTLAITDIAGLMQGLSGAATATGQISRDAEGVTLIDAEVAAMDARATVAGQLSALGQFLGQARIAADNLTRFAALTGQDLSGAVDVLVEGSLDTDLSDMDLRLSGTTTALDAGQPAFAALTRGTGQLAGRVTRTEFGPYVADGISYATSAMELAFGGQLDGDKGDAQASLTLPQIGLIAPGLDGAGRVTANVARGDDGLWAITANSDAPGTTFAVDAKSETPDLMAGLTGTAGLDAGNLAPFSRLAGMTLGGSARLDIAGRIAPRDMTFAATVQGQTVNLNPGQEMLAKLLSGTGAINARVSRDAAGNVLAEELDIRYPNFSVAGTAATEGARANANFTAQVNDLALFAPDFSGPLRAVGTARLAGGNWTIDTDVTGPGGTSAKVAGNVQGPAGIDISANGNLPLGLLNGMLEPRRITGTAGFDLRMAGTSLDGLTGTVRTAGTTIVDPSLGTGLSGIGGTVTLTGGRAVIDISGAVEDGGTLSVSGGVGLTGGYNADLTVTGRAMVLRDPNLYATTANGIITLNGPLTGGAAIAGTIDLGLTEIQIPSSGVGGLGELPEVVHIGTPGAVAETLRRAGLTVQGRNIGDTGNGGGGVAYALDLTINAPARVFVRGRGLDAELGGTMRIGGTTAQVVPSGALELIRGRLDILQQRFTLTEGRADIQGDFIPYLRLVAETEARSGTLIAIVVDGPATSPEVTFESTPELPQDEVLSQLLFGRDLMSITPLQAVQLAAAVGTLAGTGGGGIIGEIRSGLGVDDLDVVTDDQGGTALRLGSYLTENIYTNVTLGEETEVTINLDLSRDVTVTGMVTGEGETSVGIYFERDY